MAKKGGVTISLEGEKQLDRALKKMAITHQSAASKIVYSALGSGATIAKKAAKKAAPVSTGTLRDSLISGLRRKVKTPRDVFLSAVSFKFKRAKGWNEGDGGWYSMFNINKHKKNAFGKKGGNDFIKKAIDNSETKVRQTIGTKLSLKIAKEQQKQINKL